MTQELRQAPEGISAGVVLGSVAVVLGFIAASVAAAWWLGPPPEGAHNRLESAPRSGSLAVRLSPIEAAASDGPTLRDAPDDYAWVDRASGWVRIPVDVAMDVYLARQGKEAR